MKIAVCDSDKNFLNKVEVILRKISKNNDMPYIIFKYENSYELLAYFSNYKVQILLERYAYSEISGTSILI